MKPKRVLHLVRATRPPPDAVAPHDTQIEYDEATPDELLQLIADHDLVVVW